MKLAVIGSRTFIDSSGYNIIDCIVKKHAISKIISGGAKGADTLGANFATANGLDLEIFKPDWSLGRGAGMLRNTTIIENSDIVLAFWDMKSKGTADGIKKAKKLGKVLYIFDTTTAMWVTA